MPLNYAVPAVLYGPKGFAQGLCNQCNMHDQTDLSAVAAESWQAVILNLCLDTSETRRLGIDGHICELQLTLEAFAKRAQVCLGRHAPLLL